MSKRAIYGGISLVFAILGFAALGLLVSYISTLDGDPAPHSNPPSSTAESSLSYSLEPLKYAAAQWDGYGPGYDGAINNPSQVWMSKRGFIVFSVSLPQEGLVTVRTRLSSEMLNSVSANPQDSSDVTLYLNGESLGSKRVVPDDSVGQEYVWNGQAISGTNALKFVVESGLANGLVFYDRVRITLTPESQGKSVTVNSTQSWQETGLRVKQGDSITVDAKGSVTWDESLPAVGPEGGYAANTVANASDFPMPEAGCGSLVMRIGQSKYAVGRRATIQSRDSGAIELMVNDRLQYLGNNHGAFTVNIRIGR